MRYSSEGGTHVSTDHRITPEHLSAFDPPEQRSRTRWSVSSCEAAASRRIELRRPHQWRVGPNSESAAFARIRVAASLSDARNGGPAGRIPVRKANRLERHTTPGVW